MKQNTQELQNFQIVIDGELQVPTAADKAVQTARTIGHGTLELLAAAARPVASTLATMALNVEMDMHDQLHGTHVRQEYFQRKRELATAALREEVGL